MASTDAQERDLIPDQQVFTPGDRRSETGRGSSVVVEKSHKYNYNLADAPKNKKLILLTTGHVAILGPLFGDSRDRSILGWFPLPSQDKEAEAKAHANNSF